MYTKCAAFGCYNKQITGKESIIFHKFPLKRPDVLSKWVKVLERGSWKPTNYSKLCSLHFKDDDYDTRWPRTKKLKDDAVPSIFNIPDKLQGLLRKMRSQQFTLSPKSIKSKAKSKNTPVDLPYFDIVKQEPFDDTSQPFLSSANTPDEQFPNTITYSLNVNNTAALENSFPDDISSSTALTAISKSSSTLYEPSTNTEPSNLSVNPSTSNIEIKDAFSAFGEFVAKKIDSFTDKNLQVEAQQQIMNMLFEMEMKHSTKDNLPVLNSISSLKTSSSDIVVLPSSVVLISSNSNNIVAFNAVL